MTDLMALQLRPLGSGHGYYCRGDVVVAATAAIAAGVLLEADPGVRLEIGEGVCIGMGALIHAQAAGIVIAAGAHIGAGVVIIGQSTIGAEAAIGAVSTVFNHDIEAGAVIAAGSMLCLKQPVPHRTTSPAQSSPPTNAIADQPPPAPKPEPVSPPSQPQPQAAAIQKVSETQTYGKLQVQRLKHALFRQDH